MKFKYFLFSLLIISSFYFTDKIMIYVDNKNPIMKEIKASKENYYVKPVNAIINNQKIIPGIYGKKINDRKSLSKMNDFGSFNDLFLVYDFIKPDVSLDDNKDLIISRGNPGKRSVSLIIEENKSLEDYLNSNNIDYDLITRLNSDLKVKREYINSEIDKNSYSDLNSLLKKNKLSNNICLVNYSNTEMCKDDKKYIVSNSLESSKGTAFLISKIQSGDIILIHKGLSLSDLKLIINEINRQDLKIIYVSKLISEKN